MMENSIANNLKIQYESGERNFQKIELRRADLRGLDLSGANLKGADLSYANLRDVNLSNTDLSEAYLNEADLSGANLQGAILEKTYLIKTYLIKTNLQDANLHHAYLTGAYLTKSNLTNANLTGSYLNGAKLSGADLTGAFYDSKTRFDSSFLPKKVGMKQEQPRTPSLLDLKVTMQDLLNTFNYLSKISIHYLGSAMTARYWDLSRPDIEWLNQFEITRQAEITFNGTSQGYLDLSHLRWTQEWVNRFVKSCSQIIQDYHKIVDPKQIIFVLSLPHHQTPPEKEPEKNPEQVMMFVTPPPPPSSPTSPHPTAEDLIGLFD